MNQVALITSKSHIQLCSQLPSNIGRSLYVHELIQSYGLLKHVKSVEPVLASNDDLELFHTQEYIRALSSDESDVHELHNLVYDNPYFHSLPAYSRSVIGGSLTACSTLIEKNSIAIHWDGGRHHGRSDSALGFCYVNDIVISILRLHDRFQRVMYIDIDIHHGDGVHQAFAASNRVLGIDFHYKAAGFFPGTGSDTDSGFGKGRNHSLNVSLNAGLQTDSFLQLFQSVISKAFNVYKPECVVLQCGCDGLYGDPKIEKSDAWNLDCTFVGKAVMILKTYCVPLLLLGGGGYNNTNTARCWTYATACAVGVDIDRDIPEHNLLPEYGPSFELLCGIGNYPDLNTPELLASVTDRCFKQLDLINS